MKKKRGVSHSEFARRAKCSRQFVEQRIESGHLVEYPDKTLDPGLLTTNWRGRGREGPRLSPVIEKRETETVKQAVERILKEGGAPYSRPEAERLKINFIAMQERLAYEQQSGKLVPADQVAGVWAQALTAVRSRLLAVPSKVAHRIRQCANDVEAQQLVRREIEAALSVLGGSEFKVGDDDDV